MTSIVITPDEHYLPFTPCILAQIARYGRRADRVITVVPSDTPPADLACLELAASRLDIVLDIVVLSQDLSARISQFRPMQREQISYATYIRLLLPDVLIDCDEVLYLDIDILIRAPLDCLLDWNLQNPLGAVPEITGTGKHIFGTTQDTYFNAGILRMSLDRMRQFKLWEKSQQVLATRKDIVWHDQDVLNILFQHQCDALPLSFNVSDILIRNRFQVGVLDSPSIVHFNGETKPWHKSAQSIFAREWRRQHTRMEALTNGRSGTAALDPPSGSPLRAFRALYGSLRGLGHGRASSLVRALVPAKAKRVVRRAASGAIGHLVNRLDGLEAALNRLPVQRSSHSAGGSVTAPAAGPGKVPALPYAAPHTAIASEHGLDLLISVARSGTNALGAALQSARQNVNWMNELYLGAGWSHLQQGELAEAFPWFDRHGPEEFDGIPPRERSARFNAFRDTMSKHALAVTQAVMDGRQGRTLIKVFPGQLDLAALEEIMAHFRPRIIFLRRENIFTHVSKIRASTLSNQTGRFAQSWMNTDLTNVPFAIDERQALEYIRQCDDWFDDTARLAAQHGLMGTWLTYDGLFHSGIDLAVLQALYPGPDFATDPATGALHSALRVQDRRSGASVLALLKAVSALPTPTQAQLLRLPGSQRING